MPISDGFQSERELKECAQNIAEGITEHFDFIDKQKRYYFALFVFDTKHGILQYVSDMNAEHVNVALKKHLERSVT